MGKVEKLLNEEFHRHLLVSASSNLINMISYIYYIFLSLLTKLKHEEKDHKVRSFGHICVLIFNERRNKEISGTLS